LNDAIPNRGNAQGSELPWLTSFGDEFTPRWAGPVCIRTQFRPQLVEKTLLTNPPLDVLHGYPVDPSRTLAFV
jgi:hypothetical protein